MCKQCCHECAHLGAALWARSFFGERERALISNMGAGARSNFKHESGSALHFQTRERERAPFLPGADPYSACALPLFLIFKVFPIWVEGRYCRAWISITSQCCLGSSAMKVVCVECWQRCCVYFITLELCKARRGFYFLVKINNERFILYTWHIRGQRLNRLMPLSLRHAC